MQNVVLVIHLVLAICLIGVVLLQRSEGGALGIGGGGGGLVSQRGAATALSKLTWLLAAAFLTTSVVLTILASSGNTGSVLDQVPATAPPGNSSSVPLPVLPGNTSGGGAASGTSGSTAGTGGTTGGVSGGAANDGNIIPPAAPSK